ncbi:MAG TPA: acetyl-CoA C-acetyltransferase [Chloroflexota bacterium]|nr:acetyl-CoA C-acetyltransferase [Chloroflexota bacterium]
MEEIVIVSSARTAFGRLGGSFRDTPAVDLGGVAIRGAVERAGVPNDRIDHVIMGTVITAGMGQVPARQAALKAGLPVEVPAMTINKVCASGLKAVNLAAQMIKAGDAEIVVAGGMESMSMAPYLVDKGRFGYRMGNGVLVDSMMRDGLECGICGVEMHHYGSDVAAEFEINREDQDRWSVRSQRRYAEALEAGKIQREIVPVEVPQRKGAPLVVDADEQPRPDTTLDKLSLLKALKPGGSVTAGNAPGVNDGAAALVVASRRAADDLGLTPLAVWVSQGEGNAEAPYLHTVPAFAIRNALKKSGLDLNDIHLFEINEAFAAVTLTTMQILGLNADEVNVNGGAVAIGHPIGASGARILGSLIYEMQRRDVEYGAASICSGTAQGEATIVRRA